MARKQMPTKSGSMRSKTCCIDLEHFLSDSFGHIGTKILCQLDDSSLGNCRSVSKRWCHFIESRCFYWHREIKALIAKIQAPKKHQSKIMRRKQETLVNLLTELLNRGRGCRYLQALGLTLRAWKKLDAGSALDYLKVLLKMKPKKMVKIVLENMKPRLTKAIEKTCQRMQIKAAKQVNFDLYKMMSKLTGNVNPTIDNAGTTILHRSPIKIKEFIMDNLNGTDPNSFRDKYQRTPLHYAVGGDSRFLAQSEAFKIATISGFNFRAFKTLASNVKDINVQDIEGRTPLNLFLILLANNDSPYLFPSLTCQLIEYVFKHDSLTDPLVKDVYGDNILDIAASLGDDEVFKCIVYNVGADKLGDLKDKHGRTVLHHAVTRPDSESDLVRYILKNTTIDANHQDCEGLTAFQYALHFGNFDAAIDIVASTTEQNK